MSQLHQNLARIIDKITKQAIYQTVFFGDSITSTERVHPNWREIVEYVLMEKLAMIIGDWRNFSWYIRTINSGLDGSTSTDWLVKAEDYIFYKKPNIRISILE